MRAESAVEPTKSENITVTWRRSARSSGWALGALDVVAASTEGALPLASLRRAAMASSSFTRCPSERDAKLLQVLVRQARENRLVYVILAECRLVLPEAQAPQPDHNVHNARPQSVAGHIMVRLDEGVQDAPMGQTDNEGDIDVLFTDTGLGKDGRGRQTSP